MMDQPPPAARLRRVRESTPDAFRREQDRQWISYGAPWVMSREAFQESLTIDEFVRLMAAQHPGVVARQGTSASHPPHIPSLIGIEDIRYLDSTGLVRHRSIGDLMRYAILNEGLDTTAHFGDFQPGVTAFSAEQGTRFSDEQLYALALYLYSLKPPSNPNPFDDHARAGASASSSSRVAPGATRRRSTQVTSSLLRRASRFPRIFARPTTF